MNFDCGNINTENMSYSQKFAAIIASAAPAGNPPGTQIINVTADKIKP